MNERFDPAVKIALLQAGWRPGRMVDESVLERWYAFRFKHLPLWHRIHPRALQALSEFGGLSVIQDDPGHTCYRTSFHIDPLRASDYEDAVWIAHEWVAEQSLFPLGIHGDSEDEVLAMSHDGKVFSLFSGIASGIWLIGENFDEALHSLIVGIAAKTIQVEDHRLKLVQAVKIKKFIQHTAASTDDA